MTSLHLENDTLLSIETLKERSAAPSTLLPSSSSSSPLTGVSLVSPNSIEPSHSSSNTQLEESYVHPRLYSHEGSKVAHSQGRMVLDEFNNNGSQHESESMDEPPPNLLELGQNFRQAFQSSLRTLLTTSSSVFPLTSPLPSQPISHTLAKDTEDVPTSTTVSTTGVSSVTTASTPSSMFQETLNSLLQLRGQIQRGMQRNFDVITALDVLSSGRYCGMPKVISSFLGLGGTIEKATSRTVEALNHVILMRLVSFECGIPKELFGSFMIDRGMALFTVRHEFSLKLTLPGGPDPFGPWHILDFRIEDPSLQVQWYQLMNLMRLGQQKLSESAGVKRVTFPLLELYHFYHHFVLQLRFEKLLLESQLLHRVVVKVSATHLDVHYWQSSNHRGHMRIQLKETLHTNTINVSAHPAVQLPPDLGDTVALCPIVEPTTAEYAYPVTTLEAEYLGQRVPIGSQSLAELFHQCIEHHSRTLLEQLHQLVPQGHIRKSSFYIPAQGLCIAIHKKTGLFYVTSLDLYHSKMANVEKAINQSVAHLPRSLSHLATSLLLDQVEASALFLGFQPSSSSVLPTHLDLGPRMFLRLLHLVQHKDYHLAINCLPNHRLTCWVIRGSSKSVVKKYSPTLSTIVQTFHQCVYLNKFKEALEEFKVTSVWEKLSLKIFCDQWPVGSGALSMIKDISVLTTNTFQVQVSLQLRRNVGNFPNSVLSLSHASPKVLASFFMDALVLLQSLASVGLYPIHSVSFVLNQVHALFHLSETLSLKVSVKQLVLVPELLSSAFPWASQLLPALSDALNTPTESRRALCEILDSLLFWIQMVQSPTSEKAQLILKTLFRGSLYLTRFVAVHIRLLFREHVAIVSHENYTGFTTLVQWMGDRVGKECVVELKDALLFPLKQMSTFFALLQAHFSETKWLVEAYGLLLETRQALRIQFLTPDQIHFEWAPAQLAFTVSAQRVAATCSAHAALAELCTVAVPAPVALPAVLQSIFALLCLPDYVRQHILQCVRPAHLSLLFVTPAFVPSNFCLPPHLHPCLLLGNATVSLVFQWQTPTQPVLIPLVYAWKVNVVSPWEVDLLLENTVLNPSMLLERLANNTHSNRVATLLNQLKSEPYLGSNRLEWTLNQLLSRESQEFI